MRTLAGILSEKDQTIADLEEKLVENDDKIHVRNFLNNTL